MLHNNPIALLALTAQELTLCKDLNSVMFVVRSVARKLTQADGVTFVLRDNDMCYYADEDTISPLWKGSRFKVEFCISGWAMINKKYTCIEDIYQDERIPIDLYSTTYIKSLLMMPIRKIDPIGAIGCYWAKSYRPGVDEINYIQSLAEITALALDNINLHAYMGEKLSKKNVKNYDNPGILFSASQFTKRLFDIDQSII